MMRMSKHENIVDLKSASLRGARLWLAMDLASAGSVGELLKAQGPLSEAIAAIILRGTLQVSGSTSTYTEHHGGGGACKTKDTDKRDCSA